MDDDGLSCWRGAAKLLELSRLARTYTEMRGCAECLVFEVLESSDGTHLQPLPALLDGPSL